MAFIMPEVVLRRIIEIGVAELRNDTQEVFDAIFDTFRQPEFEDVFGQPQIDTIRNWFNETKIPVVMAWSFNPDRIPMLSVHLASETEDEAKAAVGDFFGGSGFEENQDSEDRVQVFTTMLDIGIHGNRSADEVLWMFYIVNYVLFKKKSTLEKLGLQLQTFSASDYSKDSKYMGDNIWTRWIRFRCTVQNIWDGDLAKTIDDLDLDVDVESPAQDLE